MPETGSSEVAGSEEPVGASTNTDHGLPLASCGCGRSTTSIDPLKQRSALAILAQRRKPVALYNLQRELGDPACAVGIEKYGYTEGAVFVLTPSVQNWEELVRQPLPSHRMSESGRPVRKKTKPLPDPFAGLELRAEYMGYGRWREGAFMVVCVRCRPEAMTAAACRAVLERLRQPTTAKLMASVLSKRERRPYLTEFPIVGGSSLEELPELLGHIQERLEDIMGISTSMQRLAGVQADDGVVVRAVTQATQTTAKPFAIVGAGPDVVCVGALSVRLTWPEGEQGLVVVPTFRMGGLRPAEGQDADKLDTQGNLDETMIDSALVALSFLRAHGGWVHARYGLVIDPRKRHGQDYSFGISPITYNTSGPSAGMACIVRMVLYLTESHMPSKVFVMGQNSISGVTTPVHSYREKMLALTDDVQDGIRPHVILSADSIESGIVVEQLVDFPLDQGTDPTQRACMYSQVRLPASLVKNLRVLGVKSVFECIELCIPAKNPDVARPSGHVAGLAVAKALWPRRNSLIKPSVTLVEAFMFPGDGQIIATAGGVGNKKIARLGVKLVYEQWHFFMEDHPGIKYRSHPEDKLYDLHVNAVESIDTPAGVGSVAWAAAAAYMALLLGIEVPAHVAFLGEIGNTGSVASPPLSQTLIETAHEHGITTIVTGCTHQAADQALLASLTAEQRGELKLLHYIAADEILPFLSGNTDPAAALPALPQPFKRQGGPSEGQGLPASEGPE